jgi:selenocysteine lyase/cysteine desulfurase
MGQTAATPLDRFRQSLDRPDRVPALRAGLIGDDATVPGPFGDKPLIYADYVASGRALRQIETFVMEEVLPYYANSHTESSYCGAYVTALRRQARAEIARLTGAGADHAVIFAGSGATAGLNRLVALLGITDAVRRGETPVVLIGPYEHHSNILPWRESGATLVNIDEAPEGGPDLAALEAALRAIPPGTLTVGAFSAASNVTGILTDTDRVTALLKRYGARAVWDYAGGGPYLPIRMDPGPGLAKDAVVVSPHKFPGGPGASGVLIVRRDAVRLDRPSWPGGGTVNFVSPWGHDYVADLSTREEAGTPNVVGDIRAALAFLVKEAIGDEFIAARHAVFVPKARAVWERNPRLELLGLDDKPRVPIFSFRVRDGEGGTIHHQLFTRMLSDCHGIQARGGCACAAPYGHRLLGLDREASDALRNELRAGRDSRRPGWVRLNLSYLITDEKADQIVAAVDDLARRATEIARAHYGWDGEAFDLGRAA